MKEQAGEALSSSWKDCLRVYQSDTSTGGTFFGKAALVILSLPLLLFLPLVVSQCPVMCLSIFSLWSSIIIKVDFTPVQNVGLEWVGLDCLVHPFPWC